MSRRYHGIEMLIEQLRAFRRIGELRAECGIIPQALVPFDIQVEVRIQEDVKCAFHSGFSRCTLLVFVKRLHAAIACDLGAPRKDRIEQRKFVLEVVVHQRRVHADLQGDVAQRHAVETMPRKENFSGVQNLFQCFGTLLGLCPG